MSPLARRAQASAKRAIDRIVGNRWITGALFVGTVTALVTLHQWGGRLPALRPGQVAPRDVITPFTVTVADQRATEARRRDERAKVLPVFRVDAEVPARAVDALGQVFAAGRHAMRGAAGRAGLTRSERMALRSSLPPAVPDAALDPLAAGGFSEPMERALRVALEGVLKEKIVGDRAPLLGAAAISVLQPGGGESRFEALGRILDLGEARGRLPALILKESPALDAGEAAALAGLLAEWIQPTLGYEPEETSRRREAAAAGVAPLVTTLPAGKVLLRRGEEVTSDHADLFRRIASSRTLAANAGAALGHLLLLTMLVFFLYRYLDALQRETRGADNLFGMNMVIGIGMALLSVALIRMAGMLAASAHAAPFDERDAYLRAIPVAAGAMAITLLARERAAMVYAVFGALVFGMLVGWDLRLTTYALVSGFAAIYAVAQYRQRTAVIKAGLVVGGLNAVAAVALAWGPEASPAPTRLLLDIAMALTGGILVALTVSTALPVLEWMFNVLTDIRLLELSNLSNPLLRRLAVQAPGTYNHSVIVGTLAEAAAQSIGGNSLLCRVAAYYHDIGKMSKPEYFIENQRNATGLHQKLSPTMSSLVIASHVKDGIKMAREYDLPKPIVDLIPQHHGTRLITYFFEKAKTLENPEIQEVSESNFRYPGPKPQSKEGAIFMMADSVEAAARTIDDPSVAKFQDMIRKIINAIVLDDQLTDTDLTFSDLDRIQESFLKTLTSLYHHRIEYPGFKFEDRPTRDRASLPG